MNKKTNKILLIFIFCISFLAFLSFKNNIKADTNVSSLSDLKTAIKNKENIFIAENIDVNEILNIPSDYVGEINGNGKTIRLITNIENMFVIEKGAKVSFKNVILEGNKNGRLIYSKENSLVTIENSTLQNGTTDNFTKKLENGVNKQEYNGGAIYASHSTVNLNNVLFKDNYTKHSTPNKENNEDPDISSHGGAIYSGTSTINIKGGKFLNNYSGSTETNKGSVGEGGAIKLEGNSTLNIDVYEKDGEKIRTLFDGNHNYMSMSSVGGCQGGSIEVTESVVNINNTDFVVKGGFDTGGAIKFEKSGSHDKHNMIMNSTFKLIGGDLPTIPVKSNYFGTSGGSIVSEGSYLTLDKNKFTMENTPMLTFAGGHIDVVGNGEFNLLNSELSGNGIGWNSPHLSSAKYGGAIAFENGCSVKANIKNTNFKNFTVDHTGGVISVGHRKSPTDDLGATSVNLIVENSNLTSARSYTFNANSAAAGIYISKGSNVILKGGNISDMQSNYGSAIYNMGNLTLENKVKLNNNNTTQMAAGIYNNGYLNVHSAIFVNNKKVDDNYFSGGYHQFSNGEHSGGTIYAKKDIIVGTDVTFSTDDKEDVRVIEGESKVILSGSRNSQINVSISEIESNGGSGAFNKRFDEPAHRHVGYLVGTGLESSNISVDYKPEGMKDSYIATPEDSKNFHYVTKSVDENKVAKFSDHFGTGVWDYVFNPENNTVVLGQRAKFVYHSNFKDAILESGVNDDLVEGQKIEQIYTFYSSGNGEEPKVSINNKKSIELYKLTIEPSLNNYIFNGWYGSDAKNIPFEKYSDDKKYDFENSTFTKLWHKNSTEEIKDILNFESRNTLDTYAVYTNTEVINIPVEKKWVGKESDNIIIKLFADGVEKESKKLTAKDSWKCVFEKLDKTNENGKDIVYTIQEESIDNYKTAITRKDENDITKGFLITNTYEPDKTELLPATKTIEVSKNWVGKEGKSIEVQLYKNGQAEGEKVILDKSNNFTHKFEGLKVVDKVDQEKENEYEVKELDLKGNSVEAGNLLEIENSKYKVLYKVEKNKITITNTYEPDKTELLPATKTIEVSKNWVGKEGKSIEVQLYKNGQAEGEKVILDKSNNFTHKFEGLKVVDKVDQEKENEYEVKELDLKGNSVEAGNLLEIENSKYKVSYKVEKNKIIITNTYEPDKTELLPATKTIEVSKNWVGKEGKSIEVQLYKNGQAEGEKVILDKSNNFTHKFEGLKVVDKVDQEKENEYEVKELDLKGNSVEAGNLLEIENSKYKVSYKVEKNKITITNTYEPNKPDIPEKPEKPDKPYIPNKPDIPDKPYIPNDFEKVSFQKFVKTNISSSYYFLSMILGVTGICITSKKKK